MTYAPPAQGTDRASHIELDLVGSTPHLDETRFGHVDSILTNVRSHDSTNVERQSLAACDVTAATTFCVYRWMLLRFCLRPNEVCEVLSRDDLPFKAVESLVKALASQDAAEAASGAARVVYQTCSRSPLLLSGRGARAMLLRAGSRRQQQQGDAAMLLQVTIVAGACLDADRSCYENLQDLLEQIRDLVDERKGILKDWVAARKEALAVLQRADALRADAKRLTSSSDADFRRVAPFPSRRGVRWRGRSRTWLKTRSRASRPRPRPTWRRTSIYSGRTSSVPCVTGCGPCRTASRRETLMCTGRARCAALYNEEACCTASSVPATGSPGRRRRGPRPAKVSARAG